MGVALVASPEEIGSRQSTNIVILCGREADSFNGRSICLERNILLELKPECQSHWVAVVRDRSEIMWNNVSSSLTE